MDTVSALTLQIPLAQGQSDGHVLMLLVAGRNHILQIHPGRVAALLDQAQELIEIAFPQSSHLMGHSGIFLIEMDTAHYSTVAAFFSDIRNMCIEVCFVNLCKHFFAKTSCNSFNFARYCSIFISKV